MWLTFISGTVICLLFLYGPGFFFFRAIGFARVPSLVISPIASLASYCSLSVVFSKIGIACSWQVVVVPACLLFLVIYFGRFFRNGGLNDSHPDILHADWASLLLYVCIGLIVGAYVYLIPLANPEHFLQQYDNAFHMQVVKGFSDSGNWSTLDVSKYMTANDLSIAPLSDSGFYPAAWHLLCALVVNALGCSVAVSINVVNYVTASVFFPMGMMLFLNMVFSGKAAIRLGSVCVLAFVGFPWMLFYWGPLYANVLAFSAVPVALSLFIAGFDSLLARHLKTRILIAFFLSVFVLVVAQTSSIFLCIIMLTPYCVYRIWTLEKGARFRRGTLSPRALSVIFSIFVVLVWTAFVAAPFMHSMVFDYDWGAPYTLDVACQHVASLAVGWVPSQPILALVVFIGAVSTLRHREYLWLTVSYVLFAGIYVLCVAVEGFPKHYFAGVWYTDSYRVFACLVMAGIPLAVQGLVSIGSLFHARLHMRKSAIRVIMGVSLALFCILVYMPGVWVGGTYFDTAFGKMRWEFIQGNDHNRPILFDEDEQQFVEQVAEILPEDALVANMPDDGSGFVYAVSGVRTYYRDYRDYEGGKYNEAINRIETPESKLVRTSANQIATNEDVRAAFERLGIRYVLLLDYGEALESQPKVSTYDEDLWIGLASVTDETPGFSVILSQGDMRLYEIMSS